MKRDWELCRTILRLTEELSEDKDRVEVFELTEQGFTKNHIGYQVYLLQDAGLLVAMGIYDGVNLWERYPRYLTWAGHDFLEATRNESTWNKTVELIKSKGGGMTLEILKDVALTFLRDELGI